MIFINCENKIFGRINSIISKMMIFFNFYKKKIIFILFNISKIIFKKKFFFCHSGNIGNLKKKKITEKNFFYIKKSIYNMLPNNKNRKKIMKTLFLFNNNI
ncbi:uL13 family ribosomal protein [Candidatus Carsonella ruddii]|uniref:Putative ribosomal protein L13 n=1 Tax=Candidatus Carsonella ruddii CE isolate Thao2000 TaxID=1202536 RepID=J7GS29_CARRU|nr:uL13 family ribosomal protein [Candidatus Carsonella ruddii]AFP83527.1 putative ribosomal protein L13 [Candidatus Carsonella ruddii CE isolate Thao2000]